MVTVHFYSEETVVAQLLYALSNNMAYMAQTAAEELDASDQSLLFRALSLSWWLAPSDHPLQAARTKAFLHCDNHALFSALLGSAYDLPPLSTSAKTTATKTSVSEIKKAIKKRQILKAYNAALAMESADLASLGIHSSFLEAMTNTIYKPLEHRILEHAIAALTAFPSNASPAAPWAKLAPGSRAGRTFQISEDALNAWGVKKPAAEELKGDPGKLMTPPPWETEEEEIAFYESYFPDDIPDEWSDEEIAKSHGSSRDTVQSAVRNIWRTAFLDVF
jgi:hypothetical protein